MKKTHGKSFLFNEIAIDSESDSESDDATGADEGGEWYPHGNIETTIITGEHPAMLHTVMHTKHCHQIKNKRSSAPNTGSRVPIISFDVWHSATISFCSVGWFPEEMLPHSCSEYFSFSRSISDTEPQHI